MESLLNARRSTGYSPLPVGVSLPSCGLTHSFSDTSLALFSPFWTLTFQIDSKMITITLKQLKVLYPIVLFLTVYVVNYFSWQEDATEMFFHHKPMFKNIICVFPGIRMPLHMNQDITILVD